MADRPLKYRDLLKRLKKYGVAEDKKRGKGSERLLVRIVGGQKRTIATKCHSDGDEKPRAVVAAIRRRLALTNDDGVSDQEFYK